MALGHTACMHAADNLIYTREVIRAITRKHGLLATFMPKQVPNFSLRMLDAYFIAKRSLKLAQKNFWILEFCVKVNSGLWRLNV